MFHLSMQRIVTQAIIETMLSIQKIILTII